MSQLGAAAPKTWTCARCTVTVSFAPGVLQPRMPANWVQDDELLYCLSCQRDMAGEAGLAGLEEDASDQKRTQLRSQARIEFEIKRDPERQDNRIAKACGTSTVSVRKARSRLGLEQNTSA